MKTILTIIGAAVVITLIFFLIGGSTADAPTDTATSTDDQSTTTLEAEVSDGDYTVNSEDSTISWEAEKSFVDGYQDSGFVPVASGSLAVADGAVADGSVTFDMTAITATETSNTSVGADRLSGHLRSDDFFATEEYPTARFEVTNVEAVDGSETEYEVTGELTIKDTINEISFPAEIGMTDGQLAIAGNTTIDRTDWDVRFRSPSFFNDLGDNAIADEVSITIDIVADSD